MSSSQTLLTHKSKVQVSVYCPETEVNSFDFDVKSREGEVNKQILYTDVPCSRCLSHV